MSTALGVSLITLGLSTFHLTKQLKDQFECIATSARENILIP